MQLSGFDHCDTLDMPDKPSEGRIVIEWKRVPEAAPPNDFVWKVDLEPPSLSDEEISRLLGEIAQRF